MIAIDLATTTFALPENWTEIVQTKKYADVAAVNAMQGIGNEQARLLLLERLAGMSGYAIGKALKAGNAKERSALADTLDLLVAEQLMEEVFPILDFLFEEPYTTNPLPSFWHRGICYAGPDEKMQSQTGWEMEECAWAYAEYTKTGDEDMLNHLIGALYRPKRFLFFGDAVKFAPRAVDKNAQRLKTLPMGTKLSILLFYQMCEAWWAKEYAFLYEGGASEETEERDSLGVSKLLRHLSGGRRGTVNNVRDMQRHEIYFELAELHNEKES